MPGSTEKEEKKIDPVGQFHVKMYKGIPSYRLNPFKELGRWREKGVGEDCRAHSKISSSYIHLIALFACFDLLSHRQQPLSPPYTSALDPL